jgi:hypothetical protein
MRLLKLEDDGRIGLRWSQKDRILSYAHTWGGPEYEVTYIDLVYGTGNNKKSLQKLQFYGSQAQAYYLHYFSVDSRCIILICPRK